MGTEEIYADAADIYKVTFVSVGRTFKFNFSHKVEKENDFTVDPSQLMRIAKGNIHYLYSKVKSGNEEEVININLSALSKQDTFIYVKQRMRMILDFIV